MPDSTQEQVYVPGPDGQDAPQVPAVQLDDGGAVAAELPPYDAPLAAAEPPVPPP
jgi:hypothetical protein